MSPEELAERVRARFPEVVVARGEVSVIVERHDVPGTLVALRDDPEIDTGFLSSVTATDWPDADPRFWVVYELLSVRLHHRVRVKAGLPAHDPRTPSVADLFPTANWHEREVFDFYGIAFEGHPNLTRILLPEGWEGFPLRKDEELGGVNTRYVGATIPPVDRRTW